MFGTPLLEEVLGSPIWFLLEAQDRLGQIASKGSARVRQWRARLGQLGVPPHVRRDVVDCNRAVAKVEERLVKYCGVRGFCVFVDDDHGGQGSEQSLVAEFRHAGQEGVGFCRQIRNMSSSLEHGAYSYSKTVAEREAWKIHEAQDR